MSDDVIDGIVGRFVQAQHLFVGEMKAVLAGKDASDDYHLWREIAQHLWDGDYASVDDLARAIAAAVGKKA